ncbi:MAG: glycosyltransferase family 1 protein [Leptolyngbyaceae cyanobacterium bins.349]|nr:glycosyltransferase family 1 protein [Leptolyngbyaceae cyanobacterium bins.349]
MQYFNQSFSHRPSLAKIGDFLASGSDLVCLSHLRWDFVYQRPQHLLSRCARNRRVFFIEEPVVEFVDCWWLEVRQRECGVYVVVPHLPDWISDALRAAMHQSLIDELFEEYAIANPILWYYTPAALTFTQHLPAAVVVYDCMDELSAFQGASPALRQLEQQLLQRADVVFTGGQSLYEAKQHLHPNIHAFPSSIDAAHFNQARTLTQDPIDQRDIPHPRLGFYGVIDERMDLDLLAGIAQAQPDWHLVMIGPVVKIAPDQLPQLPNIHYLGGKSYQELPQYLAGWDVAMLPFARNESTRFISPTKTPEYLAAGKPVVSTSIRDVVRPYREQNLVQIADTVADFVTAAAQAMQPRSPDANWLYRVDRFLAHNSWDRTWLNMMQHIEAVMTKAAATRYASPDTQPLPTVNLQLSTGVSLASKLHHSSLEAMPEREPQQP